MSQRRTALGGAPALVFVAAVLLAAPDPARAQGEPKDGAPRRSPSLTSLPRAPNPTSIRERQASMRSTELAAARKKSAPPEHARLALAQIGEDYRHIQIVNNRMLLAAAAPGALDYKSISETAKEISKRAARLKSNLALPAPDESAKRWAYGHSRDEAQLKAALAKLDKLIMGFIMSPFFRNRDVVDAVAGAKASGDLVEIIELSRVIGDDAARLGRAGGKD
jgi:hypothetical protein